MTLFEYLSVGYSIVLSLVVLRILSGIPAALERQRRYWVHALWLVYLLVRALSFWWNFWSYREVEAWSFLSFVLVLLPAGVLYMMAVALVPDDSNSIDSWRDHYFAAHRRFFSFYALSQVLVVAASVSVQNAPLVHPFRIIQLVLFALAVIGILSTNHRIHAGLAIIPFLLIPWTLFGLQQPGGYFEQPSNLPTPP